MTDKELRDAGWKELTLTTDTYPRWVSKGNPASSHWAKAKALFDQIPVVPPPPPPTTLGVDRATMLATGGHILREDTSAQPDPFTGLWGKADAQDPARIQHFTSGGDPGVKCDGSPQGNGSHRRLNLVDGDNPDGYGERCDLSRNWWQEGENAPGETKGTFGLAKEGDRKITFWSMRFPDSFPMTVYAWQQIAEWKQAQPYTSTSTRNPDGNGVTIEFHIYGNGTPGSGRCRLRTWWVERWSCPAPVPNRWIRFATDITYSQDPAKGKVQWFVDYDGAGNFLAADKVSPVWNGATNIYTTAAENGLVAGATVPNDFLIGPYRNSAITGNTYIDIDNIQVVG